MATKTISAWEARRNLGKLMDEVAQKNRPIIIESHGRAKVAMVPVQVLERLEREHEQLFSQWKAISDAADIAEEEANRVIEEAIAEVRAERRFRQAP